MSPRDRRLEEPEFDRIKDVAEQIDLLAYLVDKAADPVHMDQRPRPLNLSVPAPGLNSLLRAWAEELLRVLDITDDGTPPEPRA